MTQQTRFIHACAIGIVAALVVRLHRYKGAGYRACYIGQGDALG